ncbi:two-component system response regulator YesN [Natronobacillus azotifigens]|uniref:Response regulator n=1 Tax=Natronobacillus azotifigens TaxID=472978 RepID=A0A9J6RF79_9BACI|nr:response regulator [Natronobacillus azotifigens]MCZ0704288.1 response regulator [Natronobacillus azotifigens]
MNRVVLVDDEQFVRKGIRALVNWEKIKYQVVGEASNGEDALEMILKQKPDVVLTDIRMPIYDGLKLINFVKQKSTHVPKFVIVSGYNDFKYAQRAVRMGVTDFILKPIDKKELENTFLSLTEVIEQERMKEQLNKRFLNTSLFQRIVMEREEPKPKEITLLVGDSQTNICYVIVDIRDYLNWELIEQDLIKAITSFIGDEQIFIHPIERGEFGVVFREQHLPNHFNGLSPFLLRFKKHIEKEINKKIFLFAGELNKGFEGLRASYQSARIASDRRYSQLHDDPLVFQKRFEEEEGQLKYQYIDQILEKIEENNIDMIHQLVDEWVRDVVTISASMESVKMFIFHLEKELKGAIRRVTDEGDEETRLGSLTAVCEEKKTLAELKDAMKIYVISAGKLLCQLNKEKHSGDIYKVKNYIDKHYKENLTLKKIANEFYMNPVYLGQLFKKNHGTYFKDYLLNVRMEKAKQLLRQTDLRIYEVADQIGFSSPDYFVVQFEKKEGMTPSNYRQRILNI